MSEYGALKFSAISGADEQVRLLYGLLQQRQHVISHQIMPSYEEHEQFVKNHPYRAWYLVYSNANLIGHVYILNDNCLGLNLVTITPEYVSACIEFIKNTYEPMPAIKSVRPGFFFVNVAPGNMALKQALEQLNSTLIQHTFALKD
ncbi:MAG: hypothetical protein VX185_02535 [Pseudomonadota bacterium]|nr:hypothetical protein [Pseudomonadota bacterium]